MRARFLELLSDTFVYGLSSLIGQIASFLLLPLYTQFLTPVDYGVLAMLNIVTMSFSPLATLGLTNAAYRRLSLQKNQVDRAVVLSTTAVGVAGLSIFGLIVTAALARYPAGWIVGDEGSIHLVRIALLTAAITTLGDVSRVQLRLRRRSKTVGAINLSSVLLTIAVTVGCVVFGGMRVEGVVIGNLVGSTFGTIVLILLTRRDFARRIDSREFKPLFRYGLPLVPHRYIALGLGMYSQYYVRDAMGLSEAGLFDMAAKFAMPIGLVVNAVQEAWIPYKFQVHSENDRTEEFFRRSFTYYIGLMGFLWVMSSAWGPEALRFMTQEAFTAAAVLVPLTALSRVMNGIYYMAGTGIELSDDTRPFPLISLTGLGVLVVTTAVLVPVYGAAGAAVSNSIATLAMAIMARRLARSRYYVQFDWRRVTALAASAAACGTVCIVAQREELMTRLIAGSAASIAYAVAAYAIVRIWFDTFEGRTAESEPVMATATAELQS